MPKIIVKRKSEILKEYIIGNADISIGREEDNVIVLQDRSVSENHAIIRNNDSHLEIVDLDTSFGTYVNGQAVKSGPVSPGTVITIGSHMLVIRALPGEGGESTAQAAYLIGVQGKMLVRKYE